VGWEEEQGDVAGAVELATLSSVPGLCCCLCPDKWRSEVSKTDGPRAPRGSPDGWLVREWWGR